MYESEPVVNLCTPCTGPTEDTGCYASLELELRVVVNCQVGSENQTQDPLQKEKVLLSNEASLEP